MKGSLIIMKCSYVTELKEKLIGQLSIRKATFDKALF